LGYGIPDFYKAWQRLQGGSIEQGDFGATAYPNPCNGQLRVTLDDAKSCGLTYSIYDAVGRRVDSSAGVVIADGHGTFTLDSIVSKLPAGQYTLHIQWELRNSFVSFQKITNP
jgi:hypothetical protein